MGIISTRPPATNTNRYAAWFGGEGVTMLAIGKPYDSETAPMFLVEGNRVFVECWGFTDEVKDIASELRDLRELLERHSAQVQYGASSHREMSDCKNIINHLENILANQPSPVQAAA